MVSHPHKPKLLPLSVLPRFFQESPPPPSLPVVSHQLSASLTASMNLFFALPLYLLPIGSIFSILLPIYSLSLLCTCPHHLHLTSLTSPKYPTYIFPPDVLIPHSSSGPFSSLPKRISKCLTLPSVFWPVPSSPNQTTLQVSLPSCGPFL